LFFTTPPFCFCLGWVTFVLAPRMERAESCGRESDRCSSSSNPNSRLSDISGASTTLPLLPTQQTRRWWRLVCCTERLLRQGGAEHGRRKAFEEATAVVGAELLCLRKAKQFEAWSRKPGTKPYVLLTDWREAKPCMDILAGRGPQNKPVFTVVICEVRGQYGRASRWAEAHSENTAEPVYVCQYLTCSHTLVHGLSAQLNHVLKKNAMPTLLSLSLDKDAWPQLEAGHVLDHKDDDSTQHPSDLGDVHSRQEEDEVDGNEDAREPGDVQSGEPVCQWQEVDQVMQRCWHTCDSPVQMEQLLREAMPQAYVD